MQLVIINQNKYNLYPFLNDWLLPMMRQWVNKGVLMVRLSRYEQFGTPKQLYDALVFMVSNLKIYSNIDKTELRIELNQNLNNELNGAKLYSICKAINFGTLNCPAYPIFSDMFEFFANNFWFFFRQYDRGLLKKCL